MRLLRGHGAALAVTFALFSGAAIAASVAPASTDRVAAQGAVSDALAATIATCAACHGEKGVSTDPRYPDLAGQKPGYLVKALHDFQSGARTSDLMQPFATALGPDQVTAIAAYFARQTPATPKKADSDLARAGKIVFTARGQGHPPCASCHTAGGLLGGVMGRMMGGGMMGGGMRMTDPAITPNLAAQSASYLKSALDAFASGARADPVMSPIAKSLTQTEREAVAAYLAGLKG
ncbi:MAG: c-type cytochrome [Paracoccaceae bacterium]|nr:c-type cytochrome [Paracoccaceae bacterium]MDE3123822.1 c-type cytochrome [Paracoccaceae bacterium]MDE3238535.1 c-type cytochrome [Paracoccaceae bacterium]